MKDGLHLPAITHLLPVWPVTQLSKSLYKLFHHQNPNSVAFCKHSFCSNFGNPHPKQKQDFTLAEWADIVMMSKEWNGKCQEQNLRRILVPRRVWEPRWKRTVLGDSQDCSQSPIQSIPISVQKQLCLNYWVQSTPGSFSQVTTMI